jgi:hypothetical protein
VAEANEAFLTELDAALSAPGADWGAVCRQTLAALWYPGLGDVDAALADPATPAVTRAALLALDPANITLEPEYYAEVDAVAFARVTRAIWYELFPSKKISPLRLSSAKSTLTVPTRSPSGCRRTS